MGWDLHFCNSPRIEDILKDEEFKIEDNKEDDGYAFLYVEKEDGSRSGINIKKGDYLTYAYLPYGFNLSYIIYKLYTKFGAMCADDCQDVILLDVCENEEEEKALFDYINSTNMVWILGDILEEDHELRKMADRTGPIVDMLYKRYCDANNWHPEEHKSTSVNNAANDNVEDDLPF